MRVIHFGRGTQGRVVAPGGYISTWGRKPAAAAAAAAVMGTVPADALDDTAAPIKQTGRAARPKNNSGKS